MSFKMQRTDTINANKWDYREMKKDRQKISHISFTMEPYVAL